MTPADTVWAFYQALERRDGSAFGLVAEDLVQHAAGPQGREGLRQTLATVDHDLDSPTATIHRVVAQDDLVVVHLTMKGRHLASTMPLLAGLPPTGSPVAWDFIHIWRVADGSIVEHWACRDDVGLLAQVGGAAVSLVPRQRELSMRTLHIGLRVGELERSLAFYKALGYGVVGNVPETEFGSLTMLKLPGDAFVTLELVHDPRTGVVDPGGLNHVVVQVESMQATVAHLTARGIEVEAPGSPDGSEDFWTAWITDPDGYRIELVQWPAGHPEGMTEADFRGQVARD
jgi:catechol 2,3-dioxygenase-like lactoylglutathione lyase family enzyme/predicted ester cyclase